MARPLPLFALPIAALLTGCLLAEEDCGIGFVFDGDRCVPTDPPPPFRAGDAGTRTDRGADADPPPEPEPEPPDAEWAGFGIVLLVDRTPRDAAGQTPSTPGADIDAIQAVEPSPRGDSRIGVGGRVLGAALEDPFDGSLNSDPDALLGVPDGQVASLGAEGGFAYVALDLDRPLRRGDLLVVVERSENSGGQDAYAAFLCQTQESVQDCRELGRGGSGTARFTLE